MPRRLVRRIARAFRLREFPADIRRIISIIREDKLTYLSESKLRTLARLCLSIEKHCIPGLIIETGCALGGSAVLMTAAKKRERPLEIYDVFGMIPPPTEEDGRDVHERYELIRSGESEGIKGDQYYGYEKDLYSKVIGAFIKCGYPTEAHNVRLVKGLIGDTLHVTVPVSLAHIDVDWYEPVHTSLERVEPWLSVGGHVVVDDYRDWSGCRKAVDDYFADKKDRFSFDSSAGSMVITRQTASVAP